jgi:hypothetical protein
MLGRKDYTQDELDHARTTIGGQLSTYRTLVAALTAATSEEKVTAALEAFDDDFFRNMVLALDRPFVHRLRSVTGKDGTPLNEVELMVESLINNDGVLRGNNVITYVPAQSVLELEIGDRIRLTADQFERLAAAFFAELEAKYL